MKFAIRNHWSGAVQFEAEIECSEDIPLSIKLGLVVRWGIENKKDLTGADLTGADLTGANLAGADLTLANLTGANLAGADLTGANLRNFKACLWVTLCENPFEVPGLIVALKAGKVNGSTYTGTCACLVGTIANEKKKIDSAFNFKTLNPNANNASERWFLMIREGDTPDKQTGGGFAARMAIEWCEEWEQRVGNKIYATKVGA